MKAVLEKVHKNKPHQQKTPKSCPVGGSDHEGGGTWLACGGLECLNRYNSSSVTRKRSPVSSQMSPDTIEPFLCAKQP